ncbi:hypothetical protein [Maribacter forsetii]|uniref:hypothetical protein n=1 Tax=Maribacter forsetii TaxID=444515 RepID=UPI00055B5A99|nr:hypothetical protein [Maribacter forsetii]
MKKWVKVVLYSLLGIVLIIGAAAGYFYLKFKKDFDTTDQPYKNYIGYIDPEKALLNNTYSLCNNGKIYRTYNGAGLDAYKNTKRQFRINLANKYSGDSFTESGYINFRFLVNCDGNPGWFEIVQMNLDLEEKELNSEMVDSLLTFTAMPENWNTLEFREDPGNYYMYISYRIENGKVVEIIP